MSGVGVGVVVGLVGGRLSEFDEELSDIVGVFEEVLLSRFDLRCVAVEVSLAFFGISFAGMQGGCEDVWKKFPWES